MKLSEFELKYGGKSCTLADYINYREAPQDCPELGKVAVIVYFNKEVDKVALENEPDFDESVVFPTIDQVSEIYWENPTLMIFVKILILLTATELYEINPFILDIIADQDSDSRYDSFMKYIEEDLGLSW